ALPIMSSPSANTLPVEGGTRPAMMLNSVDFPHPLGPMILMKRPFSIERLVSCMATISLPLLRKILLTPLISTLLFIGKTSYVIKYNNHLLSSLLHDLLYDISSLRQPIFVR